MPKIPSRSTVKQMKKKERFDTKVFADRLFYCMTTLTAARKELDMLWLALYTQGLTDRGPVSEDETDTPF